MDEADKFTTNSPAPPPLISIHRQQWHPNLLNPQKSHPNLQNLLKNVCRFAAGIVCLFSVNKHTLTRHRSDPTISAQFEDTYLSSRPYLTLASTKGLSKLSPSEKAAYALSRFLETGAWKSWPEPSQAEFWKAVSTQKIPIPLPKPKDLGKDKRGRDIGTYTPTEYKEYLRRQAQIEGLKEKSRGFKEHRRKIVVDRICGKGFDRSIEEEKNRRKFIGVLEGKKMGMYEADPEWDDVIPIPQDDGEKPLAAIAYTDEYSEGIFPCYT